MKKFIFFCFMALGVSVNAQDALQIGVSTGLSWSNDDRKASGGGALTIETHPFAGARWLYVQGGVFLHQSWVQERSLRERGGYCLHPQVTTGWSASAGIDVSGFFVEEVDYLDSWGMRPILYLGGQVWGTVDGAPPQLGVQCLFGGEVLLADRLVLRLTGSPPAGYPGGSGLVSLGIQLRL